MSNCGNCSCWVAASTRCLARDQEQVVGPIYNGMGGDSTLILLYKQWYCAHCLYILSSSCEILNRLNSVQFIQFFAKVQNRCLVTIETSWISNRMQERLRGGRSSPPMGDVWVPNTFESFIVHFNFSPLSGNLWPFVGAVWRRHWSYERAWKLFSGEKPYKINLSLHRLSRPSTCNFG